jgi:hypothetical protein
MKFCKIINFANKILTFIKIANFAKKDFNLLVQPVKFIFLNHSQDIHLKRLFLPCVLPSLLSHVYFRSLFLS